MFRNLLSTLALICLFFSVLRSQDIHYTHYSVSQGLPSSQVHDIVQDKFGRLWFTTDQGLSCYDGYGFKNYTTTDGLTDNTVFKFFPQPDGKIWCTTFNKTTFCFSGKEPVFTPYRYNHILKKLPDYHIANSLLALNDGSLFMGFMALGYIHIDGKGGMVNNSLGFCLDTLLRPRCRSILLVGPGNNTLFFVCLPGDDKKMTGTWKKKFSIRGKQKAFDQLKACYIPGSDHAIIVNKQYIHILSSQGDSLNLPAADEPISVGQFTDSLFWVGFRYGGVNIYNLHGKKVFSFLHGKSVTKLLIDHEGGYWISTLNDGVFHAKNTGIFSYKRAEDEKDWINTLTKDNKGRLWMGYYHGNITMLEKRKIKNYYIASSGFPSITALNKSTGEMIFTSDKMVLKNEGPRKKQYMNAIPKAIYVTGNDSVLMASHIGIHVYYNGKSKPLHFGHRVRDIHEHQGKFYLATYLGLYELVNDKSFKVGLDGKQIIDIESRGNDLVMATVGSGIIIWNKNKTMQLDRSKGLCDNKVHKVYVENDSVIWVCTNSGLDRVVLKNNKLLGIRHISITDGLISNEVTDVVVMRDTVWVGTRQGLCFFSTSLAKEKKVIEYPYYLDITGINVNDRHRKVPVSSLSYKENRVEFNFAGVSFSEFSPLQYRYKLLGLDEHWNYTSGRSALYASLPPNAYTFILQARRHNTHWSPPVKYSFMLNPPFWKTWWFMVTVLVLTVLLVYLFFRFRILSYNRDITRELLRQLLKRLNKKTKYVVFREHGKDIRIATDTICYVKADGNYIEIHADTKKYVIRHKIGEFLELVPDPLEYLRINRSYIIRLDKVQEKSKKEVTVKGETIAVGETYLDQLQKIKF